MLLGPVLLAAVLQPRTRLGPGRMRLAALAYRLSLMTEESQSSDAHPTLEGTVAEFESPDHRRKAIDLAFDYRGDVTVETSDGKTIEGYIFDRAHDAAEPYIRVLPADGSGRVKLSQAEVTRITFSGKDTAAGKSWETWMKKWQEKKLKELAQRQGTDPETNP